MLSPRMTHSHSGFDLLDVKAHCRHLEGGWVKGKKKTLNFKKKKRKTLYTNTKQIKNHTEIEKLPKCITNKILFEEKRA